MTQMMMLNFKAEVNIMILIYTDGSCLGNPGPGGYGVIIKYENGHVFELSGGSKFSTNNRMELIAVIRGLQQINEVNQNICITTDSKYVVDSITKGWVYKWEKNKWLRDGKSILNNDLWKILISLLNLNNVKFRWIKGHAGNAENEQCDMMARTKALAIKNKLESIK